MRCVSFDWILPGLVVARFVLLGLTGLLEREPPNLFFSFFALNCQGDGYAVNVPLDSGVDDSVLVPMFRSIITKAKAVFAPEAIVLQCGASLLPGNGPSNMTCR